MFEYLVSFMLLAPTPGTAWADSVPASNQAQAMRLRTEVTGKRSAECSPPTLSLPPRNGGTLRFEERGVRYEGTEAETGNLVVRSNGPRPVTLTGDRASGGRWSVGYDGSCVGVWKPAG